MLEEQRLKRQARTEQEMGALAYEHLQLTQQIEHCDRRMAEIESAVAALQGCLTESEHVRKGIATDEVIRAAKAAGEPVLTLDELKQAIEDGQDEEKVAAAMAAQTAKSEEA